MTHVEEQVKKHNEMSKALNQSYDEVYGKIVVYLRTSNLLAEQVEEIIDDVLNMLIEGQNRGDSVESVIGKDIKVFCDDLMSAVGKPKIKDQIWEFIGTFLPNLNLILFFSWMNTFDFKTQLTYAGMTQMHISAGFVINVFVMVIGTTFIIKWLHRHATEEDQSITWAKRIKYGVVVGSIVGVLVYTGVTFNKTILATIHMGYFIGMMGLIWLINKTRIQKQKVKHH